MHYLLRKRFVNVDLRLALRRPYTFVALSLLMLLLGIGTGIEAPKDIYPYINIPVITIVWSHCRLPTEDMEGRIVTICERALTTTVNDIEHTNLKVTRASRSFASFFSPTLKLNWRWRRSLPLCRRFCVFCHQELSRRTF